MMKNVFSAALITLLCIASTASADSPHFQKQGSSAVIDSTGALKVNWQERGLGDTETIVYSITAGSTATYACINGGGKHPKATNKETVSGGVSVPAEFTSDKNGGIDGSATLKPVDKGDFNCPTGQSLVLASVCYSNIKVEDTINGVSTTFSDQCRTFINLS